MIRSMTGFGSASREFPDGTLTVALKSVNHRHLNFNVEEPALFFLYCHPGPVTYMLARAGEIIKYGSLAGIRIPGQGYFYLLAEHVLWQASCLSHVFLFSFLAR